MSLETAIQNLAEAITAATKLAEPLAALLGAEGKPAAAKKEDKPAASTKPAAKDAKAAKPAAKAKKEEVEEEEEEEEDFGGASDVTVDDVRTALQRYSKQESKEAAIEVLKKYTKTGRVDKLDEGDYGPLVEELEGLME